VALSVLVLAFASCAPQKVIIDQTATDKIAWPGPPEKPRIRYLWSISILSGGEGIDFIDSFAGRTDIDVADPKNSYRFLRPYGIFGDVSGRLYVTDPGAYRVSIIDLKETTVTNITGVNGKDFLSPIGVVAFNEKIYVSDSALGKVFILDNKGTQLGEFEGEFGRPTALALDRARGLIYVSDSIVHKVFTYNVNGKRVGTLGTGGSEKGEFNFPTHLWVDATGRLYVVDSMNFRVQIFAPDGTFESMFGTLGDAYGNLERPKGIATDSEGHIYVVDSIKDMVKIFDRDGNLLLFFGEEGLDYGQFWLPSGIFIDAKNTIYVTDTYNGRVQAFSLIGEAVKKEK
jgi:DNA-binding beta-propeller fold protein YncE